MSIRVLQGLVYLGLIILISSQDADNVTLSVIAHRDKKAPSDDEIAPEKFESSTQDEGETSTSYETEVTATTGEEISRSSGNGTVPRPMISEQPVASGLTNSRSPLDCYSCLNCTVSHGNALTRKCAATNDLRRPNLCIAYTIKYTGTDLHLRARGCTQDLGTCRGIEKSLASQRIIQIENCLECSGHLCNSSHTLKATILNLVALVLTSTLAKTVVL